MLKVTSYGVPRHLKMMRYRWQRVGATWLRVARHFRGTAPFLLDRRGWAADHTCAARQTDAARSATGSPAVATAGSCVATDRAVM